MQFRAAVFPLGVAPPATTLPPLKIRLPARNSENDIPIDLVVALRLAASHNTTHNLQLFSVEVKIPVGTKGTDLIVSPYQGSGGRMLSNPRFNVHCSNEAKAGGQEFLVFTLIPRTVLKLVPLRNVPGTFSHSLQRVP